MIGNFFVMLTTQDGGYAPLMDGSTDDEIAKFGSADAAKANAEDNILGANFGYEIFEKGCGL